MFGTQASHNYKDDNELLEINLSINEYTYFEHISKYT